MAIVFSCSCGQPLQADEQYVGQQVQCPKCADLVTIPAPEPQPAPEPPQPTTPDPLSFREPEPADVPSPPSQPTPQGTVFGDDWESFDSVGLVPLDGEPEPPAAPAPQPAAQTEKTIPPSATPTQLQKQSASPPPQKSSVLGDLEGMDSWELVPPKMDLDSTAEVQAKSTPTTTETPTAKPPTPPPLPKTETAPAKKSFAISEADLLDETASAKPAQPAPTASAPAKKSFQIGEADLLDNAVQAETPPAKPAVTITEQHVLTAAEAARATAEQTVKVITPRKAAPPTPQPTTPPAGNGEQIRVGIPSTASPEEEVIPGLSPDDMPILEDEPLVVGRDNMAGVDADYARNQGRKKNRKKQIDEKTKKELAELRKERHNLGMSSTGLWFIYWAVVPILLGQIIMVIAYVLVTISSYYVMMSGGEARGIGPGFLAVVILILLGLSGISGLLYLFGAFFCCWAPWKSNSRMYIIMSIIMTLASVGFIVGSIFMAALGTLFSALAGDDANIMGLTMFLTFVGLSAAAALAGFILFFMFVKYFSLYLEETGIAEEARELLPIWMFVTAGWPALIVALSILSIYQPMIIFVVFGFVSLGNWVWTYYFFTYWIRMLNMVASTRQVLATFYRM